MRYASERYVLGVPHRRMVDAARPLGWRIVGVCHCETSAELIVRRELSTKTYTITLPREMKRRHVLDAFRVQLRMMGA